MRAWRWCSSLADGGLLRSVVVVGLGTNGTVTTGQIRQLVAMVGAHRTLVLINTFVPRPWQDGDNEVLAAAARTHANVVLANWYAAIEHHTDLLWDDKVHPRPSGAPLYARTVASAVQSTGISRRPPRPGHSGCHNVPLARNGRRAAGSWPGWRQPPGRPGRLS